MNFLIQLIVGVVLTLAQNLFQQAKPEQKRTTGTRGTAQFGGKVPQYFLMGTVGEAGKLEYRNSWGNSGEVPNAYNVDVISFGDLPIAALSKLYVNGVQEPISGSGHVAQGYPTTGDKAGHLWIEFFNGTQTADNSYLVSKFGSDAERPWQSDMIGIGVPYLTATALWSETLWSGFPSIVAEFQGIKLYDPRKDSTAGGSGSHRWGQSETYEFSDNNAVMIYNIERGIYYEGQHIWGGRKTAADLPYAVWAAAMNACDQSVALAGGGSERRFRAGRRINLNEQPRDVIKDLLVGANARISHTSDGKVYILVGVPSVADGAFTDADVLATDPLGSIPFPRLDEIINGATATYREPQQAWEDKETSPYYRADLEGEDDDRRQTEGLDLGTTFSGTQAQRILKAVVEEARRFRKHVVALPPEFAQFRPLQVLAWTSDRFDYSAKLFLITARTRDPWGKVVFGLQEIDPADHDWNPETDEQPLSFAPVVTNRPAPQEVSGFYVEPAIALDSEGRPRRPAIDVFWSSASVTVDVRAVRITVALPDGVDPMEPGTLVWDGEAPRPELASARLVEALLPNEAYLVQIQYVPHSGRVTIASAWLPVTTPDVKLTALDVIYGDIDLDELSEQVEGYFDWMGGNIRELWERAEEQDLHGADQELANALQFDEMRRSLTVVAADLSASFEETIAVAIVPMQGQLVAVADALTELSAADEGNVNTARIRFTSMTGPAGYSRIGIETRFDPADSGDFRLAGSYWDTPNNPALPTRRMEIAQQFVIADSPASAAFQPFIFQDGTLRVANATVGQASIIDASITTSKIADASITSAKIGSAQITTAKIADGAITNAKIGTAAIGSAQIADAAITSAKIGDLSVDTIKIASGAIANYVAGSNFFPTVPNVSQAYYTSDNFVAGAFPVTMAVSGDFVLGTSGSDPDSSVDFVLDNLTAGTSVVLDGWSNSSPLVGRGQSVRVRQLTNGQTYRLRLQGNWAGTGSVTFNSAAFSITVPKK